MIVGPLVVLLALAGIILKLVGSHQGWLQWILLIGLMVAGAGLWAGFGPGWPGSWRSPRPRP